MPSPMPTQRLPHPDRLVWAAFVAALLLVGAGGAVLWRTMLRHRATADEALRDHATYQVSNFASSIQMRTFMQVRSLLRGAQWAAVEPGQFLADSLSRATMRDALIPGDTLVRPTSYFRFDGERVSGSSIDALADPPLAAALAARLAQPIPAGASFFGTIVTRGSDTSLAFVERAREAPGWVGLEIPLDNFRVAVLLPPLEAQRGAFMQLADTTDPHDGTFDPSHFAVEVRLRSGPNLLEEGPVGTTAWTATVPLFGSLPADITWTILPGAVPLLMPGGYPPAPGLPVAIAMLVALGLLAAAAVLATRIVAASRQREEFTSSVSHELRTPLANIQLYAETLQLERAGNPEGRRAALDVIVRETRQLIQMVENILALSRVGRPAHRLSLRRESLDRLAREVVTLCEPLARQAGVRVELLASPPGEFTIDPDAVRRILVNLIDNGIRHGGVGGCVSVHVLHAPGAIELRVEDRGPGIPVGQRERLWRAFERGDAVGGGSGLGLAVVQQLVSLHRGTAVLEDALPQGLLVRVILPIEGGG